MKLQRHAFLLQSFLHVKMLLCLEYSVAEKGQRVCGKWVVAELSEAQTSEASFQESAKGDSTADTMSVEEEPAP